jgi:hypothetical protein
MTIWQSIIHFTGSDNTSGIWYGFWSGFGSDLGEIALIGAVIGAYHKHNCHVKGCWRIGKLKVPNTEYVVCRVHHPKNAPSAKDILKDYKGGQ